MIRPSPELLRVAERWFTAVVSGDGATMRNLVAGSDHVAYLGSAEGELWTGKDIRDHLGAHFREAPRIERAESTFGQAFECGPVGWSMHLRRFWFEGREDATDLRMTFVWILDEGVWRIIQRHNSVPTPNERIHGGSHQALNRLLSAARDGFQLAQREGLASVMFTDIVGSSTLAEALGDRAWSALMGQHFALLRAIVEDHGGQFVKSLGDGSMSSFPSARRALTAAQAIRTAMTDAEAEPRLGLRIGLHTGDVVQAQDDFFGTVVNKAARIAASAEAGEIRLSDVTRAMIGPSRDFAFSAPATVALRGLDGDHTLYLLDPEP